MADADTRPRNLSVKLASPALWVPLGLLLLPLPALFMLRAIPEAPLWPLLAILAVSLGVAGVYGVTLARWRGLIRDGAKVEGVIRGVHVGSRSVSFTVSYPWDGEERIETTGQQINIINPVWWEMGRPVTIFLDPEDPGRCVVYEATPFRAEGVEPLPPLPVG